MSLKKEVAAYKSELIALRRDFHKWPEIGFKEFRTSKTVYYYLKKLGVDNVQNVAKTGVVGTIYGKSRVGRTVIFRVNMDGMAITEDTGLSFASQNPGVMHACGHDAHLAVGLVVAKLLKSRKDEFNGCVRLVFQPNEEIAGAIDMINEGILDEPKADCALSLNFTQGLNSGRIGLTSGIVLGNTEEFVIKIKGKSGNTYSRHKSRDAALAAAKIIEAMQVLETREYDPLFPVSIMFGKVHGGNARNVVVSGIVLEGTIRFLFKNGSNTGIENVKENFERVVKSICDLMKTSYELEFIHSNSVLNNDENIVNVLKRVARLTYDENNMDDFKSLMGEDFAEFAKRIPSALTFFGINNPEKELIYPNYHPKFDIDEDILCDVTEYCYRAIIECTRM